MTQTLSDVALSGGWVDLVAEHAETASAEVLIQSLDDDPVFVVFGGEAEPAAGTTGVALGTLDSVQGSAAHVWLRGSGSVSITLV